MTVATNESQIINIYIRVNKIFTFVKFVVRLFIIRETNV